MASAVTRSGGPPTESSLYIAHKGEEEVDIRYSIGNYNSDTNKAAPGIAASKSVTYTQYIQAPVPHFIADMSSVQHRIG